MNKQIMIKHYETTPKETLIDILVASREEVEKLQNRNKEYKREIERLNNIINEINSIIEYWGYDKEQNDISSFRMAMKQIKDLLGSDKE